MPISMTRTDTTGQVDNPGLKFDRLLPDWEEDATKRGENWSRFLSQVAACSVPDIYKQAYQRWEHNLLDNSNIALWCGKVSGRLFTGGGMPHPLETQITRNRLYGVPLLPGSGLKGLALAWARKYSELDEAAINVLFGKSSDDDQGEAGYLVFHDAWWVPDSAATPYAKEVITVHHGDYYSTKGSNDATDFDSPNPSFQLATRGSFLFAIEGARTWADLAMNILRQGLEQEGFGGKVAAGYGYFVEDGSAQRQLEDRLTKIIEKDESKGLSDEEKEIKSLHNVFEDEKKKGCLTGGCQTAQKRLELLNSALAWGNLDFRQQAAKLIRQTLKPLPWSKKQKKQKIADKLSQLEQEKPDT